ncbi:hypothetical protein B0T10DRAFT_570470 [Thelonectria olida]|uniref:Uncharacterized protein n=1 Tax=Thelonectria olida TaxID=1576542 RepID=A0A9P8WIQ4_9HYPO|nr:hypothetical protein B0T10DRAFT_570470 [Thelonectria olida]
MAALRVSVPIGGDNELDRQHFRVHISSIKQWHISLYGQSPKELPHYEAKPAVLTGDRSLWIRRLARADPSSRGKGKRDAFTAAHKTASGKETSLLSSPKSVILRRTSSRRGSVDSEEEQIRKDREEALQILEGTKEQIPDRHYTGDLAIVFKIIELVEMGLTPDLRGWKFLRVLILSRLDENTARSFPSCGETQRAFLLTTEQVRGRERVRSARNLDKCTIPALLKVMARLEEGGWRDVLWVSIAGKDLPSTVDMEDRSAQNLRWGNANISEA